ncbi:MAG: hypothetical protein B6I18_01115 [Bacteroidetes bacterium 4572_112]|nr:MAG: hypothetical protein B6I18_01115 [Bacteroidetes bacterium 4572_112]
MHKYRFITIISVLLLLFTSSCITIINRVKVNEDKSGTAFIGVELNLFAQFKNLSSDNISVDEKNTILSFPEVAKQKLNGINGISNIKTYGVVNFGRFGIEFNFANSKALNKAYYRLMDEEYKWYYPNFINIKNRKLIVKNISPYIKTYIEENDEEFISSNIIKFVNVATVIELPRKIKASQIDNGSISSNERIFTNITPLKDIMEQEVSIGFKLKY